MSVSSRPAKQRRLAGPETRARYAERHWRAVHGALGQVVVVMEICRRLPDVPDLVRLARCTRVLYSLMERCYPELVQLRWICGPGFYRNSLATFHSPRRHLVFLDNLLSGPVSEVCWLFFCRHSLAVGWGIEARDRMHMTKRLDRFACALVKAGDKARPLLESLLRLLRQLGRLMFDALADGVEVPSFLVPEIQVFWALVARASVRHGNCALFEEANKAVADYVRQPTLFDHVWYTHALDGPLYPQQATRHGYGRYTLWCSNVYLPLIEEVLQELGMAPHHLEHEWNKI
jgi:hypothetical protein